MSQEQMLEVKQIAERLQVHPETVRKWLRTGQMEGVFLGRRGGYRVTEGKLSEFLDRQKKAAA
jgi:excisionase family DNA binding protein